MAVTFFTSDAKALLSQFKEKITQDQEQGRINTWSVDKDGDFTHKAAQWSRKAWFSPTVSSDRLTFNIVKPASSSITIVVYGYYHGHIIETFLNHFDDKFSSVISDGIGDKRRHLLILQPSRLGL